MENFIDLTPLVALLLSVLLTVMAASVLHMVRTRTNEDQQAMLRTWVHIAVYAAEKLYGAGRGSEKLQYVRDLLEEKGFTLDIETLEAMVNAEIQEMMAGLGERSAG
ncbi:MAG: hypothetical protein IJT77_08570 [Clostridia bacterium]|nr:hypothetical protein [Clostridia bacterium]